MKIKGLKIAFLGDSITEGVGVSNPDKIYHQVLKKKAKLRAVYDYGISGTRIARQTVPSECTSFDKHFVQPKFMTKYIKMHVSRQQCCVA